MWQMLFIACDTNFPFFFAQTILFFAFQGDNVVSSRKQWCAQVSSGHSVCLGTPCFPIHTCLLSVGGGCVTHRKYAGDFWGIFSFLSTGQMWPMPRFSFLSLSNDIVIAELQQLSFDHEKMTYKLLEIPYVLRLPDQWINHVPPDFYICGSDILGVKIFISERFYKRNEYLLHAY